MVDIFFTQNCQGTDVKSIKSRNSFKKEQNTDHWKKKELQQKKSSVE